MPHLNPALSDVEKQRVQTFMRGLIAGLEVLLENARETLGYWDSNLPYLRGGVVYWVEDISSRHQLTVLNTLVSDLRGGTGHPI